MQILSSQLASASQGPRRVASRTVAYSVGLTRCTFVDRTRGVLDYETTKPTTLSNVRTLVTEIRYPTVSPVRGAIESSGAKPAQRGSGYPMIVFAHGYDVTPDTYARLIDAWVKAGFVVAAPFFPDENENEVTAQHDANTEDDLVNEPADLAFVTRRLLDASAKRSPSCPLVLGLIHASELALAGHSDGATVVGMLSYAHGNDPQGESYQELRVGLDYRATVVMSGAEDGVDPYAPLAPNPALLVIQSAADQCNPAREAVKLYSDIHQAEKWFLELRTAHHLPPFDGVDLPAFNVVTRTSTRFFEIMLEGAKPLSGLGAYGYRVPSVAQMFQGGSGPAMPNAPSEPVSCGRN
jgi:hypothetical protein